MRLKKAIVQYSSLFVRVLKFVCLSHDVTRALRYCAGMCLCLHNYLRLTENASYASKGFLDSEDNNGSIKSGDWRKITANDKGCFRSFQAHGGRFSYQANVVRENFKEYFLSPEGQVAWQWDYVRSCVPRRG